MSSTTISHDGEVERASHGTSRPAPTDIDRRSVPASKRILDIVLGIAALAIAAPIMLIAGILIRLTSPGQALFRQTRIGQGERPFTLLKLRTMRVDADDHAHREFNIREIEGNVAASDGVFKLDGDSRVTPVGRVLRRYSIDELPQLFNVIRGDMSLVGPRPSLPWEVDLYTPEQRRRHDCRPGITGLWQVSGRNRRSMTEMLALDVSYVERRTLALDIRILLQTPKAVFFDKSVR